MFGKEKKKDSGLAAAIARLTQAETVAFGGVGLAGSLLPETEAYQQVAAATAEQQGEVRDQLDRLLCTGTPAGRVYAAVLMEQLDPAAGGAAWTRLRDDPAELHTMTGCLMGTTTVGEYAGERLAEA
ncbi:hypothetical protein [Micromonospora endophytica]|uniref:Uncharacterized protein n=1 Tax=Micromonospora endophytica TaxID=515350 RepID=A0A2W2DQA1_9ACTN|nr:hypothetical protein [Micromonospora endophytica]PZF94943.1 hypothetical protein C1I93_15970 [Micromonospora endophytica]RIW46879.1 hypothetical protein D3H59_11540 [Micromonospora endophytica]BCJ59290.1 hypothetical protein Jiend_27120 [Micromonospora endophytica]